MSIHSRLRADLTLDERATAINELLERIYTREQQTERLRWRVAIELYNAQKLVPRGEWETWCENNIRRSLGDIRKLLKLAAAHDPQASHEAEKATGRVAKAKQRADMRVLKAEQAGIASAAWDLAEAILARFTVAETREMLQEIDIHDLIEAVEAYASSADRDVPIMSTATH
jgi:hypothetical protein